MLQEIEDRKYRPKFRHWKPLLAIGGGVTVSSIMILPFVVAIATWNSNGATPSAKWAYSGLVMILYVAVAYGTSALLLWHLGLIKEKRY